MTYNNTLVNNNIW